MAIRIMNPDTHPDPGPCCDTSKTCLGGDMHCPIASSYSLLLLLCTRGEVLRRAILYVCMPVCLSARISQNSLVQTSRNFLYVLYGSVARSSSDDSVIYYVFPVLWMTSCFLIMSPMALGVGSIDVKAVLDTK